jgi:diguanylate cyclase (GGDEF)-like protein
MGVGLLGSVCTAFLPLLGIKVNPFVPGAVGLCSIWVATALCWMAVYRVRLRRPEIPLAAAAVTAWTLGSTLFAGQLAAGPTTFPTFADVGSAAFYALMAAALVVAVRRQARGMASAVWLDAVVGSLGAAAVLAVVLNPLLAPAFSGTRSLTTLVLAAYPLCDMLLVAAVAGIAALRDVRMGSRWALLVAGLLIFTAADVVYTLRTASGTYVFGTPWDCSWTIGIALIALWIDSSARARPRVETGSSGHAMSLAVSSAATLAGVAVLLINTWAPASGLALTLAAVTLLAAAARSELAFRLLARLADLRRLAATTDELTGLMNRRALAAEGQACLSAQRGRRKALLILDLDKFKEVNDSLGHQVGDQLLVRVGARLSENVGDGDLLARLGSDEFAVLLDVAGRDEAVERAVGLRSALNAPFALQSIAVHSSVSIGIALFPDDGLDVNALLNKADRAMYKAKTSISGHHLYSRADDVDDVARLQTVEDLRTALAAGQFVMHYQPKVDLATGDVHSVEALVRWDHPTRGLLYPDSFLALVEEFGLMPALTEVVLELALDQVVVWAHQGQPLTVAVNLSASSMVDDNLPEHVADLLADRDLPPSGLQLEITEELLMSDRDRARSILARLREAGVQISVDDFGTGYSSLSYLLDLPIDELKLDRTLVFPMAGDTRAAALVSSTIGLAHSLGLRMVAEGVETRDVYSELKRLGCDQAQGYFMSRPMPAVELEYWLNNRPDLYQSTDLTSPVPRVLANALRTPGSGSEGPRAFSHVEGSP